MNTKKLLELLWQLCLDLTSNLAISIGAVAIYLASSLGVERSLALIEASPVAVLHVFIFVTTWSLIAVLVEALIRALAKFKERYDRNEVGS